MKRKRFLYGGSLYVRLRWLMKFVLLAVFAGCSSAPETEKDSLHIPGVNSQFTSTVQQRVGIDGALQEETVKFSVQVADMILEGKEQVVQFASDTLLSLIAYESNGDLSLYMGGAEFGACRLDPLWLRLPFSGDQPLTDTLAISDECVVVWNARPFGQERVVINDTSFETRNVHAELWISMASEDREETRSRQYNLWYAPELGYVVREHIVSLVHVGDQVDTVGVSERELVEYSVESSE